MLGDRIGVAAGLIDDEHARRRAGIDVDGIEARAVRGHDQEVRRPLQQILIDMEMLCDLVARRADLIGMRRRQDRRCDRIRTVVLQPVEPHVGTRFEDIDIDLIGEIFDIEDALVVDGHFPWQLSVRESRAGRGWAERPLAAAIRVRAWTKHAPKSTSQETAAPEVAAGAADGGSQPDLPCPPGISSLLSYCIAWPVAPAKRRSGTTRHVDNPADGVKFRRSKGCRERKIVADKGDQNGGCGGKNLARSL